MPASLKANDLRRISIGSVLGFGFYLKLLNNIGAGKASYVNVITPVLALSISTVYENFTWDLVNSLGLFLVIFGNIIMERLKIHFKPTM